MPPRSPSLFARILTTLLGTGLWIGLTGLATAQDAGDALDLVDGYTQQLVEGAALLRKQSQSDGTLLDAVDGQLRFEEALFLWMTGESQRAAEDFWVLAYALPDSPLRDEAEWYLAQCLLDSGHVDLALSTLANIDDNDQSGFRHEALLLRLEVLARQRRAAEFEALFQQLRGQQRLVPTEQLTYVLGRSRYQLGDFERAHAGLSVLPTSSPFYSRAAYLRGTMAVVDSDLDQAAQFFEAASEASVVSPLQRRVHDLSLLAMGRVAVEREEWATALDWYGRISGDSEDLSDALHESVWASLQNGDREGAARLIELYLLHFPDDAISGRLRVVQGHIWMEERDWERAVSAYDDVSKDYMTLRARASELSLNAPQLHGKPGALGDLPPWLIAMLIEEPEVRSTLALNREVEQQSESLRESHEMLADLQFIAEHEPTLRRHQRILVQLVDARHRIIGHRITLLNVQVLALYSQVRGPVRRQLPDHRTRLQDLEVSLRQMAMTDGLTVSGAFGRWHELSAVDAEVSELRTVLQALKNPDRRDLRMARVDVSWDRLAEAELDLLAARTRIEQAQDELPTPLLQQLDRESEALATLTETHKSIVTQSDALWAHANDVGRGRVDDFLEISVQDAHAGIADASWAQLLEVRDETSALTRERAQRLAELKAVFDDIRVRTDQ